MKQEKIGFIGAGNMATSIILGMIRSESFTSENIMASNRDYNRMEALRDNFRIHTTTSNIEVAAESDVVFICVKPNTYEEVIDEIRDYLTENSIIVTVAAGISLNFLKSRFEKGTKIVRTMPNAPAIVGGGMTAICHTDNLSEDELDLITEILESTGMIDFLPEELFDAFTGVAGSSPAYGFLLIDAISDAGVRFGLKKNDAIAYAAQAIMGACGMVLKINEHPIVLKDSVCSPGGTTIEAIAMLEKNGFRNAVIEATTACILKSQKMNRQ